MVGRSPGTYGPEF